MKIKDLKMLLHAVNDLVDDEAEIVMVESGDQGVQFSNINMSVERNGEGDITLIVGKDYS